jgi:hypothetical protein
VSTKQIFLCLIHIPIVVITKWTIPSFFMHFLYFLCIFFWEIFARNWFL